jgi:hypothetical protein
LSCLQRGFAGFFRNDGRSVEQLQDRLASHIPDGGDHGYGDQEKDREDNHRMVGHRAPGKLMVKQKSPGHKTGAEVRTIVAGVLLGSARRRA